MAYYRITACGARGDKWNVVPVGFAVRRCSQSPNVPCCPSQAGGECRYFSSTCRELAYFGFARHGEDKAWQMAVDKIFELNSIINAGDDYAPPRLKSCKPAARRTPNSPLPWGRIGGRFWSAGKATVCL